MKSYQALWVASAVLLSGCGNEFDGKYIGSTGFMLAAGMEISGNQATIETLNVMRREVVAKREFEAEVRSGKLVLIADGKTFVYGRAADEESLECLSKSCQGLGGLGSGGMPRTWEPFKPEDR